MIYIYVPTVVTQVYRSLVFVLISVKIIKFKCWFFLGGIKTREIKIVDEEATPGKFALGLFVI